MAPRLSVNINVIALLRNRRDLPWPDLLHFARIALLAGADGLTVHPRPDERHVRFSDLVPLCELVRRSFPEARFTIEGFPSDRFLDYCIATRPDQVTFVPDDDRQSTSDQGWDIHHHVELLAGAIAAMSKSGIASSIFINGNEPLDGLETLSSIGAASVELFTGPFSRLHLEQPTRILAEAKVLRQTANNARANGLSVHAGHDLTRSNLPLLLEAIPFLSEVSIGHALMADCLEFGLANSIRLFLAKISEGESRVIS